MNDSVDPEIEIPRVLKEVSSDKPINPLLERARLPGETVRLPSCGIFYTNGELSDDVEDGEVHVHPMTSMDEITITSPAKLFSGEGVAEVISRCVPAVKAPYELLAQDVDFLLLCLRKVSYGATFDFEQIHEDCKAEREEGVPIRKQSFQTNLGKMLAKTKEIDPSTLSSTYRIELENSQIVKMQPMRFKSYAKLMQLIAKDGDAPINAEEQNILLLDQLSDMILSVDEVADQKMVREWLEIVSPVTVREINNSISEMGSWGVDTKFTVKCRDCSEEFPVELPTNPLALFS